MCELKEDYDCKKLSSKVEVRYFWSKTLALGNITDISKSCMCINTDFCFPLNSRIELLIPCRRNVLAILAKVSRYEHAGSLYDTMCVKVLNCSSEYSDFISNFTASI
jgi:hypothetical protein